MALAGGPVSVAVVPPPAAATPPGVVAGFLERVGRALRAERLKLADFIKGAWAIVEPGALFVPNWHIDLISEYLMAVHLGQISLLDINMPPRLSKSTIVSVCFPCWEWTEDPTLRFLFSSYAQKQCNRDSLKRREIIQSPWYENRWGDIVKMAPDQNLKTEFKNTAQGHMVTVPVGGSATGTGGKRLITDDLMDPRRADSALLREAAVAYLRGTLSTRLDTAGAAHVNVQQRLHYQDVSAVYCKEEDGYTKLVIPMQAPERKLYLFPLSGREKVYEAGELLCPDRFNPAAVAKLRRNLMEHNARAQLDQNPDKESAGGFKQSWWKPLKTMPDEVLRVIQAWDTGVKDKETNDPSAGIKVIRWSRGYVFIPLFNDRVPFPDLKRAVANNYLSDMKAVDTILVEDKSSGQQIIQELREPDPANGRPFALPILGTDPEFNKLDKVQRAATVMPEWAAGNVYYLDDGNPLNAVMIEQYAAFPNGLKDLVDAGVHAVHYLRPEGQQEQEGDAADDAVEGDDVTQL